MNESKPLEHPVQDVGEAAGVAVTSAGTLLRQGRVAAGLHIAALAVSLKVPVRRLEALESDRFDLLPDPVFVRALASSVCRALKMDAAPVLALLPASPPPRLDNTPARTHGSYTIKPERSTHIWRSLSKPVVTSAAVLVTATLGLLAWPLVQESWSNFESSPALSVGLAPAQVLKATSGTSQAGATVTTNLPAITAPVAATLPAAAPPGPTPAISSPVPAVTGIIVFRSSAESWVEVTDARGAVVLRRMLAAGEAAGASGTLPLSAVVGRADVTKVQVRGQAFDLSSIARENVARFEVK